MPMRSCIPRGSDEAMGEAGTSPLLMCACYVASGFDRWVGKIPWRRERLPTPIFWSGEFHGLYSPWGHKESDTAEQLSFHFKSLLLCLILCSPLHEYLASEICNWEKEYFNNFLR